MEEIAEAVLEDGRRLPYVVVDRPPRGGMKYTYFAPDRSYVVQFYNDPAASRDEHLRERVRAILGRYNPTKSEAEGGAAGNTAELAAYYAQRFCWPLAIVQFPEFGLVCPTYPDRFFFNEASAPTLKLAGRDKKSHWFTSDKREFLTPEERGDFRSMLNIALLLARSVRRMHQAGLAHSDLSNNNVLIDPASGSCIIIDIDSLVVPNLFPPEVIGTEGYIAPEILVTLQAPPGYRARPGTQTDLHALAVLIYEYLFFRHPLRGPKVYDEKSPAKNDLLTLGEEAIFIEHPTDSSNRPAGLKTTIHDVGPFLEQLFLRAFVQGLRQPGARPTAMEWEQALMKTWDLLHRCENPQCEPGWFVLYEETHPRCPYCGTRLKKGQLVRFHLKTEARGRKGQWLDAGVLDLSDGAELFQWNVFHSVFANEEEEPEVKAKVCYAGGRWWLVNHTLSGLRSPEGKVIPAGERLALENQMIFRLTEESDGMLVYVTITDLV